MTALLDTTVAPPSWATGPDSDGNYWGPSGKVAGFEVTTNWSPTDGATSYLDVAPGAGELSSWQSRRLMALLGESATAVESAQVVR